MKRKLCMVKYLKEKEKKEKEKNKDKGKKNYNINIIQAMEIIKMEVLFQIILMLF